YIEGQNVVIEYRWAEGQFDRLPALVEDLVRRRVAVLAVTGGNPLIAKSVPMTVPVVCAVGADPVQLGLVASLNRPGGNITGVSVFTSDLEAKRLELLHEVVRRPAVIGVLVDPKFQSATEILVQEVRAAAQTLAREIRIVNASTENSLDEAVASLVEMRVGALLVTGGPLFLNRRDRLLALMARYALPAIYENREFTRAGGLMSYGTSVPDVYRQIGMYTGRVLKGGKTAGLPVLHTSPFRICVNFRTGKAFGPDVATNNFTGAPG